MRTSQNTIQTHLYYPQLKYSSLSISVADENLPWENDLKNINVAPEPWSHVSVIVGLTGWISMTTVQS